MKKIAFLAAAALVLLSGCATTIRSDVTAFNAWTAEARDQSYAFEAPQGADDTLEYRSYQVLVSRELEKLGLHQAPPEQAAKLLVGMKFSTIDHPVRIVETQDPFMVGPYWGPGWGRYGWGYSRLGYRPYFYDPFRFGAPLMVTERIKHEYQRQLRITINATDGRKLYDVTVNNTSRVAATPQVMPALVQSAFTGFPGQNGVPRRVDLELKPQGEVSNAAPAKAG